MHVIRIAVLLGDDFLVEIGGGGPHADAFVVGRVVPPAGAGHAVGEVAKPVGVLLVSGTRDHGDDRRLHAEVGHLVADQDEVLGVAGGINPVGICGFDGRDRGGVIHGADGVKLIIGDIEAGALGGSR